MSVAVAERVGGKEAWSGDDPVGDYARAVVAGEVVAGQLVRLACERHLRDLEEGGERGLWFDYAEANLRILFASFQVQRKGKWGGERLSLLPWQKFCIGSVYGWKRADGRRRFVFVWEEVARKNGKTTLKACDILGGLVLDDEPGPEIYVAATKKDQARLCWSEARWMASHAKAPKLVKSRVVPYVGHLFVPGTDGKAEPLGSDEDSADGLNPHILVLDEVHAWKNREYYGKMISAIGARRQPLILMITTAGNNRFSLGYEEHEYSVRVLKGEIQDDTRFAYIATIDDPLRWDDEREWMKSNPSLEAGVVDIDMLRTACLKAKAIPAQKVTFLQMHGNVWVEQRADPWLSLERWDETVAPPIEEKLGQKCFGGLDMASQVDVAAFCLWFPGETRIEKRPAPNPEDEDLEVKVDVDGAAYWWFWIPEESLKERERSGLPWREWVGQGYIVATPGSSISYARVREDIKAICAQFGPETVGYDPFNVEQMAQELDDEGIVMVKVPQTTTVLNEPCKTLEGMWAEGKFLHQDNPVARWMFGNVTVFRDQMGNMRPDRKKSGDKIDGVSALLDALRESMFGEPPVVGVFWA